MTDGIANNNIISKRLAPWIGIGASGQWIDWRDAMEAAQLDFSVRAEDLYWDRPYGNPDGDITCVVTCLTR